MVQSQLARSVLMNMVDENNRNAMEDHISERKCKNDMFASANK